MQNILLKNLETSCDSQKVKLGTFFNFGISVPTAYRLGAPTQNIAISHSIDFDVT